MRPVPAPHLFELGGPAGRAAEQCVEQRDEVLPLGARAWRHIGDQHRAGIGRGQSIENARRVRRPDAGHKLRDAETCDAVARVFGKAQGGKHVFDMRGFEKLQPAELHEGNVAAGELEFERVGMMRGAEQHRLRLERQARLAVLQHARHDVARLIRLVACRDQQRACGCLALRPEIFREALGCEGNHGVRRRQDGLRRAVVALEGDDARLRCEVSGKVEDVAHRRGAE